MERSKKALKNVTTGILNKMLIMLFAFASRTVFIKTLGAEYTGISSLYTNILSMLSLAELGLGNVLSFYLYSALRKNDKEEIRGLIKEFRHIYFLIILLIFIFGIAIIPFISIMVKSNISSRELILYYILYLINSLASYFVVYRTMVISADQKSYVSNICHTFTTMVMYVLQVLYLLIFHDFLGYLIIQVMCTIGHNLIMNHIACVKYPYLVNLKNTTAILIDKRSLFKNIKATFIFKVSDTILDQTDNIIISIMFGTVFVGFYSNYYMIIVYLCNIAAIIANGLVAGFGNLVAEANKEKNYSMFKSSMLLFSVFGTFSTVCYFCLIQDFIRIWIGQQYIMNYGLIVAILTVFYLRMVTNTVWIYRIAMGLFKEVQYINFIAALLNIILSIALGRLIGMSGVILATAVSRLLTSFWYEGQVVFKKFNKPVKIYYFKQAKDLFIAAIIISISFFLTSQITYEGFAVLIIKLLICVIVTFTIEILFNYNTEEGQTLKNKILIGIKSKHK